MKEYKLSNLKYDIPVGIIMAFVSIPISMGYAQVAGLPPVYGLYGSILPVFLFGVISTSKRFFFGVDAVPAALMGALLYTMNIGVSTTKALNTVWITTILVSMWLFLFAFLNFGRFVKFISTPVMEGFITGISVEIILMQSPKLFGGLSGHGSVIDLVKNLFSEIAIHLNFISLAMGLGTIILIIVLKKCSPKIPGSILVMFLGAGIAYFFPISDMGVNLLPKVEAGIPHIVSPDLGVLTGREFIKIIIPSFSIALVIVSESLLSSNNYAMKNSEKIDNKKEIYAYAIGNLASGFSGCCPVNGSVSRSSIANEFGVKSQVMSIVAAITMVLILMFGTPFIAYLPVPVLTAVVIASLIGILEFRLAHRLKRVDRIEWMIFYAVFASVLLLGTLYGVIVGVLFSFITIIVRAATPYSEFMGCIQGEKNFYPIERVSGAKPIMNVIIYQFNSSLFFANIGKLQSDLDEAIKEDTKVVIIDGRGIGSIDVTATERLMLMYKDYEKRGIKFFLTEHSGIVNDQLRTFGAAELFDKGVIRRSISVALKKCGIEHPYPLTCDYGVCAIDEPTGVLNPKKAAELEWAFGDMAEEKLKEVAEYLAEKIVKEKDITENLIKEVEQEKLLCELDETYEDCLLELVEMELCLLAQNKSVDNKNEIYNIEEKVIDYHVRLGDSISEKNKEDLIRIVEFNDKNEKILRRKNPKAYKEFITEKEIYMEKLYHKHPELQNKIDDAREIVREKNSHKRKIKLQNIKLKENRKKS